MTTVVLHKKRKTVPTRTALIAGAIFIATLFAYWNVGSAEFCIFDDPNYVFDHPKVNKGLSWSNVGWAFTHQHEAMWHPLTTLSHMLDVQLFGLRPGPMHIENVIVHAISSVVLLIAMIRLTGALGRSAVIAGIFALHPLHVESVAWIAERKDVLSGLFFMLTLLAYANYARKRSRGRYLLVALALSAGLMSKPMVVTTPFVLLLLDYWPLERWRSARWLKLVIEKLPLLALCIALSIITFFTQQGARQVGQLPLGLRATNAIVSYLRYIGKAFWPTDLAVFYPYPHAPGWPTAVVISSAVALLLITVVALALRREFPYLIVGWLWFIGMLFPVIGLIQVGGQAMADRYAYLPLIGLSIAFVWLAADALRAMRQTKLSPILALVILGLCLMQTMTQASYWTMNELLFSHALDVVGENALLRGQLATAYRMHGRIDRALEQIRTVLRYEPNNSEVHRELAIELNEAHHPAEAREEFMRALQCDPHNPSIYVDLARYFLSQGNPQAARESVQQAKKIDPSSWYLNRFLQDHPELQ